MSVKPDTWIRFMSVNHGMITPFVDGQVREGVVSYGLSSYGYDIRIGGEFRVCVRKGMMDPHNMDKIGKMFISAKGRLVMAPGQFVLAPSLEHIKVPRQVQVQVLGKSTYARMGLLINVTPLEPEWEGIITLELVNLANVPIVYPNEGIAQLVFHSGDGLPEVSYADKHGKYQGQTGITMSRLE